MQYRYLRHIFQDLLPSLYRLNKCRKLFNDANPTVEYTTHGLHTTRGEDTASVRKGQPLSRIVQENKFFFAKLSVDAYRLTGVLMAYKQCMILTYLYTARIGEASVTL